MAYVAATVTGAVATWTMIATMATWAWLACPLGCNPQIAALSREGMTPLLAIGAGLLIVPLRMLFYTVFVLPVLMPIAYPLAFLIARRRQGAYPAVAGAILGPVLGMPLLAPYLHITADVRYPTDLSTSLAEMSPMATFPAAVIGATIGWVVARLHRGSTPPPSSSSGGDAA